MARAVLVKPSTAFAAGGFAGAQIAFDGTYFVLKIQSAQFSFWSPVSDVSGDGDLFPTFENSCWGYGKFQLQGAMVANLAIGLQKLAGDSGVGGADDTQNETRPTLQFVLGGDEGLTADGSHDGTVKAVIIERVDINWAGNAPFVGVSMSGYFTDTELPEAGKVGS